MTARAIADAVLAIEARVLHLDWRVNGVDLWPLYRNEVRGRLSIALIGATSGSRFPHLSQFLDRREQRLPPSDESTVVLLNNGFSRQIVGGRAFDRLCTPLATELERSGQRTLLLDQGTPADSALAPRVRGVGARVRRAKLAGVLKARLGVDSWTVERCAALAAAYRAEGIDTAFLPTARDMYARQIAMFDLAMMYEGILREQRANLVLQVCFYSVAGYAMNLAAHRVGAPVLDIQHGVIDPTHTAYVDWAPTPAGRALLPDGVWTWSDAEAELVRRGLHLPASQVVAGGHPFVAAWQAGWLESASEARADAAAVRSARPDMIHALITLQPGLMTAAALGPLLEAMREAPDVFWWIRQHPVELADETSRALFDQTGAKFDLDLPSSLPLYAALEQVDIHLTHSSSTVAEAEAFGVPSLLWSDYGKELFSDAIERGWAVVVVDGGELARAIGSSDAARPLRVGTEAVDRLLRSLEALRSVVPYQEYRGSV
ncbi:MAG TPA: hypothetical protein DCY80_08380 [Solibacterales bacterium]|nr:hypothetical protein [Bryobacterales bacterium]